MQKSVEGYGKVSEVELYFAAGQEQMFTGTISTKKFHHKLVATTKIIKSTCPTSQTL